jgi:hypothetical protein
MSTQERLSSLEHSLRRLLARSTNRADTIALTEALAHVHAMQTALSPA